MYEVPRVGPRGHYRQGPQALIYKEPSLKGGRADTQARHMHVSNKEQKTMPEREAESEHTNEILSSRKNIPKDALESRITNLSPTPAIVLPLIQSCEDDIAITANIEMADWLSSSLS